MNINLLQYAISILNACTYPDKELYNSIADILRYLSYYVFDDSTVIYMIEVLDKYHQQVRRTSNFRKLISFISPRIDMITDPIKKKKLLNYLQDIDSIMEGIGENQGVVYSIIKEGGYGFFKNIKFPGGVYFRLNPQLPCAVGDIIVYDQVYPIPGKGNMIRQYKLTGESK